MSTFPAGPTPAARPLDAPAGPAAYPDTEPIRGELYGPEHLGTHARQLAAAARLAPARARGQRLLRRFLRIGRDLDSAYRHITTAARQGETITPDAEWLLDNYHIVAEALREVRHDLPRGYYNELPKLALGPFAGYPRVYALAVELIAHTDSSLEEATLTRFVQAYQEAAPLTIGELWAVPIMLRLSLLDNLRRLASQMLQGWLDRQQAERWKRRLVEREARTAEELHLRLNGDLRAPWHRWTDPFVVHLLQLLRDHGPEACSAIAWLEQHLARRGATPAEVLRREHQRQAANQVSVGNGVTSLRLLSALDWARFFERTSLVEAELRQDPAGAYARQDFSTRDRFRRAVERLARGTGHDERTVARRVLHLAHRPGMHEPASHVGYYLEGAGRAALEADLGYRPRLEDRLRGLVLDHPNTFYFGGQAAACGLLLAGVIAFAAWHASAWPLAVLAGLAALLPVTDLAVGLVHYLITLALPPRVLPKLDFTDGIAEGCETFIVMPTMLLRPESAQVLCERLEVHYLSNPDPRLRFALLTDFADAPTEHEPEDEAYLQAALAAIRALNQRYPLSPGEVGGPDRFHLFHRRRQWDPVMRCWMGWERKRGKLLEFNRLLRGARDTSFSTCSGDPAALPSVRFVITLDADTQLPREAAQRLVGTLAHPLNRPRFDPAQGRVVTGYGVLQPRVSLSLSAATRSRFARVCAGSAGLDPYTTAVSDVYQDLFGEGSFTGKGIYDVDAFEAATGHTFPDDHILSHDLIEGTHARCGLVTDIELLDDFPALYPAYARREHRWVRGDWQLLPWLGRRVPGPVAAGKATSRPNPLPLLARWKVFDNLRRSLIAPALLTLLVLGWTVLPGSPWFWTGLALAVPFLPLLLVLSGSAADLARLGPVRLHWRGLRVSVGATAAQGLLTVVFLADQARLAVDAIVRTLVRLFITRRHLLEWETAASTERRLGARFEDFCRAMGPASLLAAVLMPLVLWANLAALPAAAPLLVTWLVSPAVAWWISRPSPRREPTLTPDDRRAFRRLARRTWGFFETFVTGDDNDLPPDNFQEDPKGQAAHRTSPTNIGLYLLSAMAAHDFGFLGLPALLDRLERTFDTLDRLPRRQGHFYNWYDTCSLQPLQPLYVSTVDSGNLLGGLVALKQGLREKPEEPIVEESLRPALGDALGLVEETLRGIEPPDAPEPLAVFADIERALERVRRHLADGEPGLRPWHERLARLDTDARELAARCQALARVIHETPGDLQRWATRLAEQVQERRTDLATFAPWLGLPGADVADTGPLAAGWREDWKKWYGRLLALGSPAEFLAQREALLAELGALTREVPQGGPVSQELASLLGRYRQALKASSAGDLLARCQALADRAAALAAAMDFRVLYNEQRHLFSIGLNESVGRLDAAHYDLLASEACLTSFLAVARGQVPRRHWFQLGRPLTRAAGGLALLSWGGTMFEYLMPRLLLRAYPGTLLEASQRTAVDRQIEYGRQEHVPWGISESGFGALDAALDYQYQSFGVPGLGLKRGLARDLVIAPYATALALAVHPRAGLRNFEALAEEQAEGAFGFYEAVDYTRDRLRPAHSSLAPPAADGRAKGLRRPVVVRSYMAHHQGMILVALANCLLGEVMPRRFHAEPAVRATELLLQERVPLATPLYQPHGDEALPEPVVRDVVLAVSRRLTTADTPHPRVHLLSNGRYSVMLTNAGAGSSTCRDLDVTGWREDRTRDCWGQFYYVRDLRSGLLWSAGHQPLGRAADEYEVVFSTDKAEFRRSDGGIETHYEIAVSPENNAEVRRLTFTNHNPRPHDLEVTSYAEVALCPRRSDQAHPAFAKLFLETEFVAAPAALFCRRRPRAADQEPVWAVHVLALDGKAVGPAQYETDRARFLGRGRTPANPAAVEPGAALTGTTGPVLDPVLSLRRRVRVPPGGSVSIAFTTAVAHSREEALALADQYHSPHSVTRAFELAWAHSQVELRHLHLSAEEAHLFQRLAGHVIFVGPALRPAEAVRANRQGQAGLWRHGISGDKPIVLCRVAEGNELPLVRQLLLAHTYWRLRGLEADLVILNEHPASYLEELHRQLQDLVRSGEAHALTDKPGGVFLRRAAQLSEEDRVLLQAAARVVLTGDGGSLAAQLDRRESRAPLPPPLVVTARRRADGEARARHGESAPQPGADSLFFNGVGGFSPDGREYVLHIPGGDESARPRPAQPPPQALPPAPWINVVANPACGFLVSESGSGYTWAGNSQANRLTVWSNDPVSDPPAEVVYLRDEATGVVWTPTPLPRGSGAPTSVHHGQGYTRFRQSSHDLDQELLLLVPPAEPVKLVALRVRNAGSKPRRLSATFYAEWVLGTFRDQAPLHVVSSRDAETGALLAWNAFNDDFAGHVAFAATSGQPFSVSADRTEFLGRNGSPAAPAALGRTGLSGTVGAALDPCAALMAPFELQPGEEKEVVFLLGQGANLDEARRLIRTYREPGGVGQALDEVGRLWDRVLNAVQVATPDPAFDLMLNRWLPYQALSCRVWGRSAFYQSGGAYGFRDQLQDVMALVYGAPGEARAQLLRAAGRQFLEGDVQHWWHPPAGRGVRTRFSDDLLWLPYVACHYVAVTGDASVLDEPAPFLRAPVLRPDQEEEYGLPEVTSETASLYEHCVRALEHGYRLGTHGLPLMGTGDWNDGMNKVGAGGKGESVWDAWFLLAILPRFAELAEKRGDGARATWCSERVEQLRQSVEAHAWDGRWYRRAYFDDGTPLGSAENDECKIDSIAQSWAVLSGAADPSRAEQAMAAVEEHLVREADKLILLFAPPFDHGKLQPGYIKGYVPGIRENGGQYTHAATWVVQAAAHQGHGKRAVELFDLLNPIRHTTTPEEVSRYKVEPYVVAADVYSQPPHVGRGGWTWYTGSASWLYRVGLENILGFRRRGHTLHMDPCVSPNWPKYELIYRHGSATYHIIIENPDGVERGVRSVIVDGRAVTDGVIALSDDGEQHEVRVRMGSA